MKGDSNLEYNFSTAMDQALRFLAPRFLSRLELTQKLKRKQVPDALIEEVLARLEELDYIDDERLSREALRLYMEAEKYSETFIRQKMYQRGLTVGSFISSYDESSVAYKLCERHFLPLNAEGRYEWGDTWDEIDKIPQKKVFNYLKNRGFKIGTIQEIARKIARFSEF
ncbi:regulatory protein RecX [uncultured Veillonella sp.]|uniref:regulatory protein RecX n=1 Tax=uncultured Veillonella sp. TaxID=159268 RepID=UPI0025E24F0E|nr:regulatory protein RecX [uncultured Veillonella sp.]MDY3973141.1 regulatory protein RecX [Veillonella caviae]